MAVKIPQEYLSTDYDFGFSGVSEAEYKGEIINKVEEAATSASEAAAQQTAVVYQRKLGELERIVMPLLVNLLKTSDKEYIYWPDRQVQIEDKIEQVLAITRDS